MVGELMKDNVFAVFRIFSAIEHRRPGEFDVAVLPGFAYQLGNLITSRNSIFQQMYADRHNNGSLNMALSGTVVLVAIAVAVVTGFGPEAKGAQLHQAE